jgi:hypothetical protein
MAVIETVRAPTRTTVGIQPRRARPLVQAPLVERHLGAALLAVIRRRELESSVLPGLPFH